VITDFKVFVDNHSFCGTLIRWCDHWLEPDDAWLVIDRHRKGRISFGEFGEVSLLSEQVDRLVRSMGSPN
jgi:hypothetical protein